MAGKTFTTRPVKDGLPTLFEIEHPPGEGPASAQREVFQTIALVTIADALVELVEQASQIRESLNRLGELE